MIIKWLNIVQQQSCIYITQSLNTEDENWNYVLNNENKYEHSSNSMTYTRRMVIHRVFLSTAPWCSELSSTNLNSTASSSRASLHVLSYFWSIWKSTRFGEAWLPLFLQHELCALNCIEKFSQSWSEKGSSITICSNMPWVLPWVFKGNILLQPLL